MAKLRNEEPYLLKRYRIVFWVLMVAGVAYVVYHWTDRHRTERIVAEKPEYAVGRITGHFERSTGGGRYSPPQARCRGLITLSPPRRA